MRNMNWKSVLALVLAAFFVVGGIGNILASATILEDYRRWGFPDGFNYVTGTLELIAAVLIAWRPMRVFGAALAAAVMTAAAGTVLFHGEFTHAIAPATVLIVTLVVGVTAWRDRPASLRAA